MNDDADLDGFLRRIEQTALAGSQPSLVLLGCYALAVAEFSKNPHPNLLEQFKFITDDVDPAHQDAAGFLYATAIRELHDAYRREKTPPAVRELRDLHPLFAKAAPTLWPDRCMIRPHHGDRNRRCDFLLQEGDIVIPVEIKKGGFGRSAMNQLHGYLAAYQAPKGIAVGHELKVPLPANIEFVSIAAMEEAAA